jgi:hypothetical protein
MGSNFMDRAPRARVLAAGYRQGLIVGRRDGPTVERLPAGTF